MAESMTFTLRGRDELTRVLNGAGDSAARLRQRLDDTNGGLRNLRATLTVAGDGVGNLGDSLADASKKGSALPALLGATGVAATTLLPAIGGLAPMLVGVGVAGAAVVPIFNGVKKSWDASGKSGKEYKKALKDMPGTQRAFTAALKDSRKEFEGLGDEIRKDTFDEFTNAIVHAQPVLKTFRGGVKDMSGVLADLAEDAGKHLGSKGFRGVLQKNMDMGLKFVDSFTRGLGKFGVSFLEFGSKSKESFTVLNDGFSGLLGKDLPGMFQGMERGISGSSKAWQGLFDMIADILPAFGRFSGQIADTFGPAVGSAFRLIGRLTSAVMDGLGPAMKAVKPLFDAAADQMDLMGGPVSSLIRWLGKGLGGALRIVVTPLGVLADVLRIGAPYARNLATAIGNLIPAFDGVSGSMGWLDKIRDFASNNKLGIQAVFTQGAGAVMDFIDVVVSGMPLAFTAFRTLAEVALTSVGTVIRGLAAAFGDVPIIGDKLKRAASGFSDFEKGARKGLKGAEDAIYRFSATASSKLKVQKLKMDISNYKNSLDTAKAMLKDPAISEEKKVKIRAHIKDLERKIANSKAALQGLKGKQVNLKAKDKTAVAVEMANKRIFSVKGKAVDLKANDKTKSGKDRAQSTINSLDGVARPLQALNRAQSGKNSAQRTINSLSGVGRGLTAINRTGAGVGAAQRTINGLVGKHVTVTASLQKIGNWFGMATGGLVPGFAGGGPVPGFADGGGNMWQRARGMVSGPGTSTSDSIRARLSAGEFVMRAAAVRKYGSGLMAQLNSLQVPADRPAQRQTSSVLAAGRRMSGTPTPTVTHNTYVYPQRADFGVHDLDTLQRVQETRDRVGRPV